MKELSIEQKAQRYDEAIERANSLLSSNQLGNAWIYKLFPELKESDDEKIRKEIKQFIRSRGMHLAQSKVESWVAWLEKQGKPLNESVYDTEDKEIYQAISIGLTDVFNKFGWSDFGGIPIENIQNWIEKQGEQILANSAKTCKDEQKPHWNVGDTLAYYGFYSDREGECVLGKVTNVEFNEEQCDWFYTFEDGSVYDEQSLLEDQTYKKN